MNKTDRQARIQQMKEYVENWQKSNLTQKQFAKQNNINYSTFICWIKKFRDKNKPALKSFISLRVNEPRQNVGVNIEIRYPNGVQLSVPPTMDFQIMSQLIRLI
jgi:predicted transcriptional regulator